MSEIQVGQINSTDGSTAITTGADGYVSFAKTQIGGRRNLIINGAMQVWQRGTSADTATAGDYMCDRWQVLNLGLDGNLDWDQETASTPDGFGYALKVSTDASNTSLDAGDLLFIRQKFEGQDLQQLQKGTSGAKSLNVSFWVKSSVASTYTVELFDVDNSRSIGQSYTISSANTWEFKTVTFEGDTVGALANDNGESFSLEFWIDAGSTYTGGTFNTSWQANVQNERVYDTTGWLESTTPTFYITGVQLEVGTVATPFEHRSYGEEMELCRRYYFRLINAANEVYGQGFNYGVYVRTAIHPQTTAFRALPSLEYVGPTTFYRKGTNATNNVNTTGNPWEIVASNKNTIFMQSTISDTSEDGVAGSLYLTGSGCHVSFNAEL